MQVRMFCVLHATKESERVINRRCNSIRTRDSLNDDDGPSKEDSLFSSWLSCGLRPFEIEN